MEVDRKFEFAPIKNADIINQIVVDSPASARQLLLAESTYWLEKADVQLSEDAKQKVLVSPLLSYEGEGINKNNLPR